MNSLPLELYDIILEKSLLHWDMNSSSKQDGVDVINSLASVDVCWFHRITKRRFRKRFLHRLKGRLFSVIIL